jgi:hypothetical protein
MTPKRAGNVILVDGHLRWFWAGAICVLATPIAVVVLLLLLSCSSHAQEPSDGVELLKECDPTRPDCYFWLSGYLSRLVMGNGLGLKGGDLGDVICPPTVSSDSHVREMLAVIQRFIHAEPGVWHLDVGAVVLTALIQAYPCEK